MSIKSMNNIVVPTPQGIIDGTSTEYSNGFYIGKPNSQDPIAYCRIFRNTGEGSGVQLEARRYFNDTIIYNSLRLGIQDDQKRRVVVSEAAPWHRGLAMAIHTSTAGVTAASGVTVTAITMVRCGWVATVRINFTKSAATSANTEYTLGTITDTTYRPTVEAGAVDGARQGSAWIAADGTIKIQPAIAYGANTSHHIRATYIRQGWTVE